MTEQDSQRTLTEDERAELERLRAQEAELRAQVSRVDGDGARPGPSKPPRRRTWPRTTVGYVLIALAALLAPLSVVAVWARSQVTDTDRYVETVAPLASDPAVQSAVTTNITNVVFRYLDVQGLTQQAIDALSSSGRLPPAAFADLVTWSEEHAPLAHRAIHTLVEQYHRGLNDNDQPELGSQLAAMMLDATVSPALRVELAALLRDHHLLTPDLLDRLTNMDQPGPIRLFAAEQMLRVNPHDPDGVDVLRGLARQRLA